MKRALPFATRRRFIGRGWTVRSSSILVWCPLSPVGRRGRGGRVRRGHPRDRSAPPFGYLPALFGATARIGDLCGRRLMCLFAGNVGTIAAAVAFCPPSRL